MPAIDRNPQEAGARVFLTDCCYTHLSSTLPAQANIQYTTRASLKTIVASSDET